MPTPNACLVGDDRDVGAGLEANRLRVAAADVEVIGVHGRTERAPGCSERIVGHVCRASVPAQRELRHQQPVQVEGAGDAGSERDHELEALADDSASAARTRRWVRNYEARLSVSPILARSQAEDPPLELWVRGRATGEDSTSR